MRINEFPVVLLLGPVIGVISACQTTSDGPEITQSEVVIQSCNGGFAHAVAFIGLMTTQGCQNITMPSGQVIGSTPLFDAAAPGRLSRYCRLSTNGTWPSFSDIESAMANLYGPDPAITAGPDHIGLVPQGPLESLVRDELRSRFHEELGAPDLSGLPPGTDLPVIALLDSAPSHRTVGWSQQYAGRADMVSNHGLTLARIMEEMLCADGDPAAACLAEVHSRSVLNLNQSMGPGNSHGSLADLAEAIYDAVEQYRPGRALVINMSLGWVDPVCMGGAIGDVVAGEQAAAGAVHEAIQYARCQGAMVVAAAGNEIGPPAGPLDHGFIHPAAWRGQPGPEATDCQNEFTVSPTAPTATQGLVLAAGAVAAMDQPIGLAREGGEPELVAPGAKVTARRDPYGADSTMMLSGTSVSAAAVSAAAAAMWWADPTLDPVDLEQELYAASSPISRSAPPPGQQATRRLHMRAAMDRACIRATGGDCGLQPFGGTPMPLTLGAPVNVPLPLTPRQCTFPNAPSVPLLEDQMATRDPCDFVGHSSIDEAPVVHPQPDVDPCPPCLAVQTDTGIQLYLDLDPRSAWLEPVLFTIEDNFRSDTIQLPDLVNQPGYFMVEDIPIPIGASADLAGRVIFWDAATGLTTASEIPIYAK